MAENFANFYATTLQGAIDDNDTLLTVASPLGAPDVNFRLLIQDAENDITNRELVLVTVKAGDDFTVTRGIEGTTPVAHADGSFIAHVVTAGGLLELVYDRVTNVQASIVVVIDGGDGAITPGVKADLSINFGAVIDSWEILADRTGSIAIDIWKDSYANFPPTDVDSIVGTIQPAISSDIKAQGSDLTGWDGVIGDGDILRFNVDSASTIVKATLILKISRS